MHTIGAPVHTADCYVVSVFYKRLKISEETQPKYSRVTPALPCEYSELRLFSLAIQVSQLPM